MSSATVGPARERILETASRLFYRHGFVSVGVDTIVAEAGVAKMSLYRHFPSKDDLIVAYLERSNTQFWGWFEGALGQGSPREQLVRVFEELGGFATSPACFGCMFQLAAADFPDPEHPANRVALAHKRSVIDRLRDLAARAGSADPDALASQLLLLMDGAFVASRMFRSASPAAHVGGAAASIIKSGTRRARLA
ncbi:MAG TPA: TetR/AcrR family transcriptional regulator [Acidimicrobiales bacterium]|nr:TetR/AcrR family transcriptional regulator [Acidimicrobiales bacterium]